MLNRVALLFLLLTAGILNGMASDQENASQNSSQSAQDEEASINYISAMADQDRIFSTFIDAYERARTFSHPENVMSTMGLYIAMNIPFDALMSYQILTQARVNHAVARLMSREPVWVLSYALACIVRYVNPVEAQSNTEICAVLRSRIQAVNLLAHRISDTGASIAESDITALVQDTVALEALFILPTIVSPWRPLPEVTPLTFIQDGVETTEPQHMVERRARLVSNLQRAGEQRMARERQTRELELENINQLSPLLLFTAIQQGSLPAVSIILRYNRFARAQVHGRTGNSPVHFAAIQNQAEILRALLQNNNQDVDAPNANGFTALHLAIAQNNLETVRALLENGASANTPRHGTNESPLIIAHRRGASLAIIDLLVSSMSRQSRTRLAPVLRLAQAPVAGIGFNGASN